MFKNILILYVAKYGGAQYFKAVLSYSHLIFQFVRDLEARRKHFMCCPATIWVCKRLRESPFLPLDGWWRKSLSGSSSDSCCCSEPQVRHHYQKSSTQVSRWCKPTPVKTAWWGKLVKPSSLVGSWLNVVTVNSAAFPWRWPLLNLESKWTPPPSRQSSSLMASMLLSWGLLQVGNLIPSQNEMYFWQVLTLLNINELPSLPTDETYSSYLPTNSLPLERLLGTKAYLELNLISPYPDAVLIVNYCIAFPRSARNALVFIYKGSVWISILEEFGCLLWHQPPSP